MQDEDYRTDPGERKPNVPTGGWFPVPNALVRGGWATRLTEIEKDVLLQMLWYQNMPAHVARPGAMAIAKGIGHKDRRHVDRAISRLLRLGWLRRLREGGGHRARDEDHMRKLLERAEREDAARRSDASCPPETPAQPAAASPAGRRQVGGAKEVVTATAADEKQRADQAKQAEQDRLSAEVKTFRETTPPEKWQRMVDAFAAHYGPGYRILSKRGEDAVALEIYHAVRLNKPPFREDN